MLNDPTDPNNPMSIVSRMLADAARLMGEDKAQKLADEFVDMLAATNDADVKQGFPPIVKMIHQLEAMHAFIDNLAKQLRILEGN